MGELRGFGNPVSPSGRSSLVDDLPHHISAEAIQVTFRIDPDQATQYLPDTLELTDEALGYAYVADMVKVSQMNLQQPHTEPQRTQYREALVGLYCQHNGARGRFLPSIWVTADWSLVFGHFVGFAKKQGDVWMTKIHSINPAMGPVESGARLRGVVNRLGQRVMTVDITLEESLPDDGIASHGSRVYTYRHIPSPSPDAPPIRQLLAHELDATRTTDIWRGTGAVELFDGPNEDLRGLTPLEIVDAHYFKRGWTISQRARLLVDYEKDQHYTSDPGDR